MRLIRKISTSNFSGQGSRDRTLPTNGCTMKMKTLIFTLCIATFGPAAWATEPTMKEVRTFMPFNYPVDPAKIVIIPDMDLSYGLASTLVEWSATKQITAGLASRWEITGEKTYKFTLRDGAKWSDGSPITAQDVKRSFERSFREHAADLRSLLNIVARIEAPSERVLEFQLKMPAKDSNLLGKLTEPNYGVLNSRDGRTIDLAKTSGPFFLDTSSKDELALKRNSNWHRYSPEMAERVVIRRTPPRADSQSVLLKDSWPNLIETSSLISSETLKKYETNKFQVWKRPLDKVFLIELGKRARNDDGFRLLRSLGDNLDRNQITEGLSGFQRANQLFPVGYQLHNGSFECQQTLTPKTEEIVRRKLDVLISPARVSPQLQENLRKALARATGEEPNFIVLALQEAFKRKETGDFDLYIGTYGLADPDPEGVMSFYLEGDHPVIPSGRENYVAKLDAARKESDLKKRLSMMRSILTDAQCNGNILPLFHLSTVGIGREELDFSAIPTSDESVTLSKIRFK